MSAMKTLQVPTATITDLKRSPTAVFERAEQAQTAVYVFNRGSVSGVMLTREQYENMAARIERLEDDLLDAEVARRLQDTKVTLFSDAEVRGAVAHEFDNVDDNDGWA